MPNRAPAADPAARPALAVYAVFGVGVLGIAGAAILVRLALPAPPVPVGFYRMLFATAVLGLWLLAGQRRPGLARRRGLARREWPLALGAGACFGTDLALWNTSINLTSVATSTLLVNTTPVWVGLYAWAVLRTPPARGFALGAALGLAGAALLVGRPAHERESLEGALLALAAALFYSGYLLLMKATRRTGDTLPALCVAGASAAAVLGLYAALRGDPMGGFPASSWAAIAALTAVSQIGGVMGIVWALRYLPATVASVALLGQPLGTAALGWLVLGEALAPLQALGGLAILLGIALAARTAPLDPGPLDPGPLDPGPLDRNDRSREDRGRVVPSAAP